VGVGVAVGGTGVDVGGQVGAGIGVFVGAGCWNGIGKLGR